MKQQITEIDLKKIFPNPLQPRKEFNREKIRELANSIKQVGLINPIQVKKISDSEDKFEIICGERRYKAHKLLKLKKINAIIKSYEKGKEKDEMIESLVENLQRGDLNSIEKENYIYRLWELGKFKSKIELGKSIGYSETYIRAVLRAKKLRDKFKIDKNIPTRNICELNDLKKEDVKSILKKIKKENITGQPFRDYIKTIKKCDDETKNSLFKNEIDLEQANQISKIKNPKIKKEVIKAHKEIKKIDKQIDKDILKKVKKKNEKTLIQSNEFISSFRQSVLELQNKNQSTIKSFLKCVSMINLMDNNQVEKINYNLESLENNIQNMLRVLDKAKLQIEKVKN